MINNGDFIVQNSSSYTNEYSNFPHKIITQHHFMDADNSIASLINKINSYKLQGNFDIASKLISENANLLSHYIIDATTINTIEEEIRNVQVMALQKHQCVYYDETEPEFCAVGDLWEGGT